MANTLHCEQCGRLAGPEMIACPERAENTCAYRLQKSRPNYAGGCIAALILVVILAWITVIPGYLMMQHTASLTGEPLPLPEVDTNTLLAVTIGMVLALVAAILMTAWRITLVNLNTGAMWQRNSLLGFEVSRTLISDPTPLALDLALPQPLAYPASIAALGANSFPEPKPDEATGLLEAALVGLLAQGTVTVRQVAKSESRWGGSPLSMREYLIVPCEDQTIADGVLEQRILDTLHRWPGKPATRQWPQAPTVYELVRAVYERDQDDPWRWLLRLVLDDAASRQPDAVRTREEEAALVGELYAQLLAAQPVFAHTLRVHVNEGIQSRQDDTISMD